MCGTRTAIRLLFSAIGVGVIAFLMVMSIASAVHPGYYYEVLFSEKILVYPEGIKVLTLALSLINGYIYQYASLLPTWATQIAISCVMVPILEEIEFRGPLYLLRFKRSQRLKWSVAALSTLLFLVSHSVPIGYWLSIGTVGLSSSILVMKTKRLWPSIVMHGAYNLIVIVAAI